MSPGKAQPEAQMSLDVALNDTKAIVGAKALYRNIYRVASKGIMFCHEDILAYDNDVYYMCRK